MEMDLQNEYELERRMRAAFEPEAESVDRVVAAAMRPRPRRPMKSYIAAALALAAISIIAVRLWFPQTHVQAENIRLEYVGSVALIEFPDGSSWVVSPDKINQGPHAQLNLIILEGDKP
jgi:ferric-dicitrate binding protein FerR (iron transport regulator)